MSISALLPVAGAIASAIPQALGEGVKTKVSTSQLTNISFNPVVNVVSQSPMPSLGYSANTPQTPSISMPVSDIEKPTEPMTAFDPFAFSKRDVSAQFPETRKPVEAGMFEFGFDQKYLIIIAIIVVALMLIK